MKNMQAYFGIFHPFKKGDGEGWLGGFGVTFPDVSGAITEGHDLDEAVSMAVEALSIILGWGRKGREYKAPSSYEEVRAQAKPDELVFPIMPDERIVAANSPKKRVQVMLPGRQLSAIGGVTRDIEGMDRSKFIALAIDYYLAEKYPDAAQEPEEAEAA